MSKNTALLDEIAKLTALAESSNENEATLAAQRAQRLMLKHAISAQEVENHLNGQQNRQIEVEMFSYPGQPNTWEARAKLYHGVANAFGIRFYPFVSGHRTAKYAGQGQFVGFEGDIESVKLVIALLESQMVQAMMAAKIADGRFRRSQAGFTTFRATFYMAFARRVTKRLQENKKAVIEETSGSQELVLASEERLDEWALENLLFSKSKIKHRDDYDWFAAKAGQDAADRADLGTTKLGESSKKELGA